MIVKRKLFSFLDEEGNLGYYLYNETTGEEKLFSVVEEEREFARGTGAAVHYAEQMVKRGGQKAANKAANKKMIRDLGDEARELLKVSKYLKKVPGTKSDVSVYLGKERLQDVLKHESRYPEVLTAIDKKIPGNIENNKLKIEVASRPQGFFDDSRQAMKKKKYYKIR